MSEFHDFSNIGGVRVDKDGTFLCEHEEDHVTRLGPPKSRTVGCPDCGTTWAVLPGWAVPVVVPVY